VRKKPGARQAQRAVRGAERRRRARTALRRAASAAAAVAALATAAAGCSSSGGDGSGGGLRMSELTRQLRAAPVLRWKGSWPAAVGKLGPGLEAPPTRTVTADLRALGNGDVFGTVSIGGAPAQVLQVGGEHQFVKAGADYWRVMAQNDIPLAGLAGRWVAQKDDPQDFGLDLRRLVPSQVALDLSAYRPPAPSPGAPSYDPAGTASPEWSAAPSDGPARHTPPGGVPRDAVRFDTTGLVREPEGEPGDSYWFTARAPHRLVGYFGGGLLTRAAPGEEARLTVAQGGKQEAEDAYADLAARLRSIPRTVTVAGTRNGLDITLPEKVTPCAPWACLPVRVGVRLHNGTAGHTIGERVTVTLYGTGRVMPPEWIRDPVGTCSFAVEPLAPGESFSRTCSFDDQRIARLLREHRYVWFRVDGYGVHTRVTGPSEAEELARRLPAA
jgi:hypothetical protein